MSISSATIGEQKYRFYIAKWLAHCHFSLLVLWAVSITLVLGRIISLRTLQSDFDHSHSPLRLCIDGLASYVDALIKKLVLRHCGRYWRRFDNIYLHWSNEMLSTSTGGRAMASVQWCQLQRTTADRPHANAVDHLSDDLGDLIMSPSIENCIISTRYINLYTTFFGYPSFSESCFKGLFWIELNRKSLLEGIIPEIG